MSVWVLQVTNCRWIVQSVDCRLMSVWVLQVTNCRWIVQSVDCDVSLDLAGDKLQMDCPVGTVD